jgi:diaminopimelate epimerase
VARVSFKKYEGLGNDFLLFELPGERLSDAVVRRLCDRHFGVGADGVLLVGPPKSAGSVASMTILAAAELVIDTDAGPLTCKVEKDDVEVQMGQLVDQGPVEITLAGRVHRFARVSAGNPHAITFEPYTPAEIDVVGPAVARAAAFSEGTNVEFARLEDDGAIELVVWERGVGRTLACGTGATATVGAACLAHKRSYGEYVEVRLPGGALQIRVRRDTLAATMRGPAHLVFEGEVTLP